MSGDELREPGLFGIVEGWQVGEAPDAFLSSFYLRESVEGDADWTRTSDGKRFEWDEIASPILVRDGVPDAADDTRRKAVLFNDITRAPLHRKTFLLFSDRLGLRDYLWDQGWRREVRSEDVTER